MDEYKTDYEEAVKSAGGSEDMQRRRIRDHLNECLMQLPSDIYGTYPHFMEKYKTGPNRLCKMWHFDFIGLGLELKKNTEKIESEATRLRKNI